MLSGNSYGSKAKIRFQSFFMLKCIGFMALLGCRQVVTDLGLNSWFDISPCRCCEMCLFKMISKMRRQVDRLTLGDFAKTHDLKARLALGIAVHWFVCQNHGRPGLHDATDGRNELFGNA